MIGTEIVALFELRGRYWYYQFEPLSRVTTDSCLGQRSGGCVNDQSNISALSL
ncbi:hypothetical protein N644_1647 [Lactiplantibacillus paraplantarum]|nr:hypothetical protein N644_1647 [Lactiplantibacillus paraplantarum]KRL46286.1 hypothetical protein FD48_GL002374 [Lactiplantibacillus paraplantarum DSM 10667]